MGVCPANHVPVRSNAGTDSPSVTLALKLAKVCQVHVEDIFSYQEEERHET